MAVEPDAQGWRGLEPASLAINLVPDLWRTLRTGWPLLVAIMVSGGVTSFIDLLFFLVFLASSLARTVVHFLTLRYRLADGKLEIHSGLLGRRHRVIDPVRIQNIELVQNVFHRAFGLVELRVETAGESGAAGLLSALSLAEAESLRAGIQRVRTASAAASGPAGSGPAGTASAASRAAGADAAAGSATKPEAEELERTGLLEVLGHGVTEGRAGAALVLYGIVQEWGPTVRPELFTHALARPGSSAVLMVVFVSAGYLWSVTTSFVRYYGFVLSRTADGLRTRSGLFTRRRVEIPAGKVQMVRIDASWVLRLMGYASLQIETAGSNAAPGEGRVAEALVPMVADDVVPYTLDAVLSGFAASERVAWSRPARAALVRAVLGGVVRWGGSLALIGHFLAPTLGLGRLDALAGVGVLLGIGDGYLDYVTAGWKLTPSLILVRSGFLSRVTSVLPRAKIQSAHLVQGPIQRQFGVWQVHVWVAGGRVATPELNEREARAFFEAVSQPGV